MVSRLVSLSSISSVVSLSLAKASLTSVAARSKGCSASLAFFLSAFPSFLCLSQSNTKGATLL